VSWLEGKTGPRLLDCCFLDWLWANWSVYQTAVAPSQLEWEHRMVQGSVRCLMGPAMVQDFRFQWVKRLGKVTEDQVLPPHREREHRSAHPAKRLGWLRKHLDSKKADPIISRPTAMPRDIQSPKVLELFPPL